MRLKLGWEGYGLYWGIIEILRDRTDHTGSKDYNEIAFELRVSAGLIKQVVEGFGLFTFTDCGKRFYSKRLSHDMDKKARISEKRRQAIQKRWEKRDTSVDTNVCTNEIQLYEQEKGTLSSPHKENEERSPIPPKEVKEIYPPIIPPKESAKRGQCARTHEEGAKGNFGEVVGAEVNTPSANISAAAEKEKSCAKKEREWTLDLPEEVNYYPEEERILSQASNYAEVLRGAEEDSYPQATRGDFATVMSWWNMNIARGRITVVGELTRTRRYKLIERIAEWRTKSPGGSLGETLSKIEKQIEASSLLRGDKGRWVITFDWLIADDTNWVKVLEGNYNDNTNNNKNGTGDRYANRRGREGAVASAESFTKWDGKF